MDAMSAQLQMHLRFLQRDHRPSLVLGEEPNESQQQRLPPLKRPHVHSGSSTSTGVEGVSPHEPHQYTNAMDGRRFSFSPLLYTQSTAGAGARHH